MTPHDPFARIERALLHACFDVDGEERLEADPATYLAHFDLSAEERDYLASQVDRIALYRTLVRNNVGHVVFQVLPRCRALFARGSESDAPPLPFHAELARFLEDVGPRDHTLRAIPSAFAAWALPRWRGDPCVAPWLPELLAHEIAVFEIATQAAAPPTSAPREIALDRAISFHPTARLARYQHTVHAIPEGAPAAPERRDVALLLFRDAHDHVAEIELDPAGATLVERLLAGATLGDAARDTNIEAAARLLGELGEAGAISGAR